MGDARRSRGYWQAVLWAACLAGPVSLAQRTPVLGQIDLPHPYYYREMFLPQLTGGPSSLTWSPDSTELIYSMAGSLWRQRLDGGAAEELPAGSGGYDYQPDWSPDGRWVIFTSYQGEALELYSMDLRSGAVGALTTEGAVNVEPRFSPDGRRVVFVSTRYHRRFHVFTADFADGRLMNIRRLTGEHRSELPRYYYSAYDHEIDPVWSRDGHDILYVSNRDHVYGTGGFWRIDAHAVPHDEAAALDDAREIHYEETNWKAHPDLSPDGSRLLFSCYVGRGWHNLWIMPVGGGDAFPLAYGDWDQTNARWSPNGERVAFISNRSGGTQIEVLGVPGGDAHPLPHAERRYRVPRSHLRLTLRDTNGAPAAARVSITDSAGRFYAPDDAWIHADDGFDRRERSREAHYFQVRGDASIDVPAGVVQIEVMNGFERPLKRREVTVSAQGSDVAVDVDQGRWSVPSSGQWVSADVHVHMNYGGVYRNTPAHLVVQAQAENLNVVNALIVNKEQRFPDISHDGGHLDPASAPNAEVIHGQEYHTSFWGHLGLLDPESVILPGYAGYPNTAAASLVPMNADIADLAHARGALVGYVHPFDEYPDPEAPTPLTHELPIDVALGKVDYMEILGFSDHRATAAVWYRLLNLGFRIPAAGGTDAMTNFASLRGPVGMNRVYVRVADGADPVRGWRDALKAGRSFATNGPLLGFQLGGFTIGDDLVLAQPQARVAYSASLRSIVPVDHLELVCNGRVIRSFLLHRPADHGDFHGTLPLGASGWCALRASTDEAHYPVLDNIVYATTSPIYVTIAGRAPSAPADARYFRRWIERVAQATSAYPDWNSDAEKIHVQDTLRQADGVFAKLEAVR